MVNRLLRRRCHKAATRQEVVPHDPDEEGVEGADTKLHRGDGHAEATGLATRSIEGLLVLDVIKRVAEVPERKVQAESNVATFAHVCRFCDNGELWDGGERSFCRALRRFSRETASRLRVGKG